jgi:hypothetical protein
MNFIVENLRLLIWGAALIVVAVLVIVFLPRLLSGSGAREQQGTQPSSSVTGPPQGG